MRERIPEIPSEPVDKVVLRSVCLVGDYHDVGSIREHWEVPVCVPVFLGQTELLHRREDDATRCLRAQQLTKVLTGLGLHGCLRKSASWCEDFVEQLIVEVVPIRQHDDGWVCHSRMAHHLADVEQHFQALSAPLGMPDDPSTTVSPLHRREGRVHGLVDSVELVVLGKTLDDAASLVREADEVADEVQEASRLENPSHEDLHLGSTKCSEPLPVDCLPGCVVLEPPGERSHPSLRARRDDTHSAVGE